MDLHEAVRATGALAHPHRMHVFRLLVREGPSGLAAGEVSARLGIAPSALSFHLAQLERAGLVRSWRRGRNSLYAIEVDAMRQLLWFLTEDCCGGRPEICSGIGARRQPRPKVGALTDEPR